jgi:non-heme chloroperoxidase
MDANTDTTGSHGEQPAPETVRPRDAAATRRPVLAAGTGAALTAASVIAARPAAAATSGRHPHGFRSRIPVAPGVEVGISDLDGGRRGTVVFVPGWPLASTTFEYAYLFLADHSYRVHNELLTFIR